MEFSSNRIIKESNKKKFKNLIHKNKNVSNSPILLYRNFIKCFFIKENILTKTKININTQRAKSEKNSLLNKSTKSQKNSLKIYKSRKTYYKNNIQINETIKQNPIDNNIQKKMTIYPQLIKRNENKKIIKTMYTKQRRLTNPIENINNIKTATNVSNKKNNNKINKNENITAIKKIQINSQKKNGYKKLLHPKSKNVGLSLDNILSKKAISKAKTKIKTNSYDNNNPKTIKKSPNIKLKHMENKLNTEKISKNKKYIRVKYNQIKSENLNLIKIKNPYLNNKTERKVDNSNKSTKRNKRNINTNKKYDSNNDSKLISDNVSTNYKSINTKKMIKSKKDNINTTPNIIKKKNVKMIKKFNDNTFKIFELMKENDGEEKINGVKINNFDINKPKDENLKFTFAKDDKQSDLSVSRASKVIIGKIEGYRDIIETDKAKNHYKIYSNLYSKKLNKLNLINFMNNSNKNSYKKINNCSNILKKENDSITFNDDEFYENLNISNNWDGMSSTNTNNKITGKKFEKNNYDYNNDSYYLKTEEIPGMNFMNSKNKKNYSKKYENNLVDITIDDCGIKNKMVQNSDNCVII